MEWVFPAVDYISIDSQMHNNMENTQRNTKELTNSTDSVA